MLFRILLTSRIYQCEFGQVLNFEMNIHKYIYICINYTYIINTFKHIYEGSDLFLAIVESLLMIFTNNILEKQNDPHLGIMLLNVQVSLTFSRPIQKD